MFESSLCPGIVDRMTGALRVPVTSLFNGIVGGFPGDHDIVDVAFAEAGAADAHEAGLLQEFGNLRAAAVAHARLQATDHLVDDHRDRAAVRHTSFDALGDELREPVRL